MFVDTANIEHYRTFLRAKRCPVYRVRGRYLEVPDEYAHMLGEGATERPQTDYSPHSELFDYQRDIAAIAIRKRKFAVFADCGLGKTLILLEFARHAARDGRVLIVSPLMVCPQTADECERWYGERPDVVSAADLPAWLESGEGVAITNYESIRDGLPSGRLAGLVLDESSMLKSHYGKWGRRLIDMGRGVPWKLALTGTPAPNDRIEYANHSVFLDVHRSTNEFLARYFVNRGQTDNRWEIKPHALRPFYRDLSHWAIFLSDPSVYGWKDNCDSIPPIHVHVEDVPMTPEQTAAVQKLTGGIFAKSAGGIGQRSKLGQIAKGRFEGRPIPTNKPGYIRNLVESWPNESTIVWCLYNDEQDSMEKVFPDAVSISGSTPYEDRVAGVEAFKRGERRVLITKPKILGFGLNLQIATRQVFSGLQDSYESFYQAVKRSNRIGSTRPLNVHIPVTDVELPMVQTVLSKADRVESDTQEQERMFREGLDVA